MSNKCISWIWENIYVSDLESARNGDLIKKFGIRVIVSCLGKKPKKGEFPSGVTCYHFPLRDNPRDKRIIKYFDDFSEILDVNEGKRVLVHCRAGISRSPSIVIGNLCLNEGYNFFDALKLLRRRRNCVNPNYGFCSILKRVSSYSTSTAPVASWDCWSPNRRRGHFSAHKESIIPMIEQEKVMVDVGFIKIDLLEDAWKRFCLPGSTSESEESTSEKDESDHIDFSGTNCVNGIILSDKETSHTKRIRVITVNHLLEETDTSESSESESETSESSGSEFEPLEFVNTGDGASRLLAPEYTPRTHMMQFTNRLFSFRTMNYLSLSQKTRLARKAKFSHNIRDEKAIKDEDISLIYMVCYYERNEETPKPSRETIFKSIMSSLSYFYGRDTGKDLKHNDESSFVSASELLKNRSDFPIELGLSAFLTLRRPDECVITRNQEMDVVLIDFKIPSQHEKYFINLPQVDIFSHRVMETNQTCLVISQCGDCGEVSTEMDSVGYSRSVFRTDLNGFFSEFVKENESRYRSGRPFNVYLIEDDERPKTEEKRSKINKEVKEEVKKDVNDDDDNVRTQYYSILSALKESVIIIENMLTEYLGLPFFRILLDLNYDHEQYSKQQQNKIMQKEKEKDKDRILKMKEMKITLDSRIKYLEEKVKEKDEKKEEVDGDDKNEENQFLESMKEMFTNIVEYEKIDDNDEDNEYVTSR